MTRSYWPLLLILALIWGASYLFIKVAVEELAPTTTMALRLVLAAALLLAFLVHRIGVRRAFAEIRGAGVDGLVLGVLNTAVPFTLIGWGEQHIDSGVAAIANASVPIFNALLAVRFLPSERIHGARLAGVLLGLFGVAVLAGVDPAGGWPAVAGTLAVVLASLLYAAAGIYGQRRVSETAGPVLAAASTLFGALVLLPFALVQAPSSVPSWEALGSIAALGVLGTALAQLILFRMLRLHGSARLSLVTYLMPPIALVYGALLLGEEITVTMLAGLGLILLGVALGSGAMRTFRRAAPAPTP
ncbi:MAG: DMT family transporter [Actinomycetota bacterium]|nr:DMT family transporter [Actinomycetota bacterium]